VNVFKIRDFTPGIKEPLHATECLLEIPQTSTQNNFPTSTQLESVFLYYVYYVRQCWPHRGRCSKEPNPAVRWTRHVVWSFVSQILSVIENQKDTNKRVLS